MVAILLYGHWGQTSLFFPSLFALYYTWLCVSTHVHRSVYMSSCWLEEGEEGACQNKHAASIQPLDPLLFAKGHLAFPQADPCSCTEAWPLAVQFTLHLIWRSSHFRRNMKIKGLVSTLPSLHRLAPAPLPPVDLTHLDGTANAFDNQTWLRISPGSPYTNSMMLHWKKIFRPFLDKWEIKHAHTNTRVILIKYYLYRGWIHAYLYSKAFQGAWRGHVVPLSLSKPTETRPAAWRHTLQIRATCLLLHPASVKQAMNTRLQLQFCLLPRSPVCHPRPGAPSSEEERLPPHSLSAGEVQGGAATTSWHCLPSLTRLLVTRLRTLSAPWKFPCWLVRGPILGPAHTRTHIHTLTHSSLRRRPERQPTRETTAALPPTLAWRLFLFLQVAFLCWQNTSLLRFWLLSALTVRVGHGRQTQLWATTTEGQGRNAPFPSAFFFNLTAVSKASYNSLFKLLQRQSLNLFRPLVPNNNWDIGHISVWRAGLFLAGFLIHRSSCVRIQGSPTGVQVSSAIPRGFHYSRRVFFS